MSREINMYNPTSPGVCLVMECQERFEAALITGTLEYPLVNRQLAAKLPRGVCGYLCPLGIPFKVPKLNGVAVGLHLHED